MNTGPNDHPSPDQDNCPAELEADSHTFVIRIWLEESDVAALAAINQPVLWRGHITHAIDRRRQYFQDLNNIYHFINPYLDHWRLQIYPDSNTQT